MHLTFISKKNTSGKYMKWSTTELKYTEFHMITIEVIQCKNYVSCSSLQLELCSGISNNLGLVQ